MGLWRLLGGEVNWERVAKMQDRGLATEIHGAIIHALGGGLSTLKIDRLNDDDKNNVMWVLEKFGRQVPDLKRYPFLSKSYLDPQQRLKQKHSLENQKDWDQAWEWYDAYKSGTIPFLKYRIQIREKELEEHEENLKHFKAKIEKFGKNRKQIKLIKSYERDILEQKAEIAKLKAELEPLKKQEQQKNRLLDLQEKASHYGIPTREIKEAIQNKIFDARKVDEIIQKITKLIDAEKQNNNINNADLSLENENLRLKKEILEMELKLKEVNKNIEK